MAVPPSHDPDADLMLRVKRGGKDAHAAFAALVERWQQPLIGFVYRTLPDETEAEDLAQAVFVQVWKTADRYQPSAKFSTFLFTVARNLCLNELRRRSRHPADSLDEPRAEDEQHPLRQIEDARQPSAADSAQQSEIFAKVEAALAELPEKQRTAIVLCREGELSYEEIAELPEKQRTAIVLCREGELSYEEIAEVLGTSLQATKSIIFRGREYLKARLKPYLRSGEWGAD